MAQNDPTLSTTPSPATVTLGPPVTLNDVMDLEGGFNPTGSITFTLVGPDGATVDTEMVLVNGNGLYSTPTGFTPSGPNGAGTYQWNATYSGDANNTSGSDVNDPNEQVKVPSGPPTISDGQTLEIFSGQTSNGITVLSGGTLQVDSGGTALGTVDSGGTDVVHGSASGTIVSSGGTETVESGGTAIDTVVSSGGSLVVSSGGFADPTIIMSAGFETISAGGSDDGAQISGGEQDVFGTASNATIVSGFQVIEFAALGSNTTIGSGGVQYDLGTASGTTLSGGTQVVYGSAAATTVASGGTQNVVAGGTATGGTVSSGGTQYDAGTVSGTTLSGGTEVIDGTAT
jgi:autotransporter passenger strand-loop-strand repeat protein